MCRLSGCALRFARCPLIDSFGIESGVKAFWQVVAGLRPRSNYLISELLLLLGSIMSLTTEELCLKKAVFASNEAFETFCDSSVTCELQHLSVLDLTFPHDMEQDVADALTRSGLRSL